MSPHKPQAFNKVTNAWIAFVLNCLLSMLGAYMKIMHYPGANETLLMALLLIPVLWGLVIWDILSSPIRNKPLWMIAIFVSWNIGALVYLLRKNALLNRKE